MRKAFTLIELIVVIAIIAVLAAIVAPNAFKAIEKGKVSALIGDYKAIKTSAMAYYSDIGSWPVNVSDGSCFVNNTSVPTASLSSWDGPYLEKWPARAPWGGNYTFNSSSASSDCSGFAPSVSACRYVNAAGVPAGGASNSSAGKIDVQLDGAANSSGGSVKFDDPGSNANTTLHLLVSFD